MSDIVFAYDFIVRVNGAPVLTLRYMDGRVTGTPISDSTLTPKDFKSANAQINAWWANVLKADEQVRAKRVPDDRLDERLLVDEATGNICLRFRGGSGPGKLKRDTDFIVADGTLTTTAAGAFDVKWGTWRRMVELYERLFKLIEELS